MIREISAAQFPILYKKHIRQDFARNERRPLHAILGLYRKGCYRCLVLIERNQLQAYACLLSGPGATGTLLDYFAVAKPLRGTGVGSRFLAQLRQHCNTGGLLIESEMPAFAPTAADKETCARRIAFYTRAGATLAGVGWHAFGVNYNLLWLPVRKQAERVDIPGEVQAVYHTAMPPFIARRFTRTFPLKNKPGALA